MKTQLIVGQHGSLTAPPSNPFEKRQRSPSTWQACSLVGAFFGELARFLYIVPISATCQLGCDALPSGKERLSGTKALRSCLLPLVEKVVDGKNLCMKKLEERSLANVCTLPIRKKPMIARSCWGSILVVGTLWNGG